MIYLSKSKYCSLCQCPKIAWLSKFKPEVASPDDDALVRMEAGREVGNLAKGLFGPYVDVTAYNGDVIDNAKMIQNTKVEMEKGTEVICEAAFSYDGMYCAVDILKKEGDGWAIYEVKSSSKHKEDEKKEDREVYLLDISFQKHVLEQCGVNITGTYLVCLNGDYVFDGQLNISELFRITDVSEAVDVRKSQVSDNIAAAEEILLSIDEPDIDLSINCFSPYQCVFWPYCSRHIPKQSVFNLYRMKTKKKFEYYKNGWISYTDLLYNAPKISEKQLRQIKYGIENKGTYINKEKIREFLGQLSYPLYFLDFETMQPVIPRFVGTRPYMQIPFQYSLHYIEKEGGELKHKEYLAESGVDPRRELAERLCKDIPMNACVTAYNKQFERTRIKELAELFPDLAEHLLNIYDHIFDLLDPFSSGWYYNREMGGSFSIKTVLPAIFPDEPELNYHNLEGVHNGGEAMSLFPRLASMSAEEREEAHHNLLKYCELDTFAMVKIWQELVRVTKD